MTARVRVAKQELILMSLWRSSRHWRLQARLRHVKVGMKKQLRRLLSIKIWGSTYHKRRRSHEMVAVMRSTSLRTCSMCRLIISRLRRLRLAISISVSGRSKDALSASGSSLQIQKVIGSSGQRRYSSTTQSTKRTWNRILSSNCMPRWSESKRRCESSGPRWSKRSLTCCTYSVSNTSLESLWPKSNS